MVGLPHLALLLQNLPDDLGVDMSTELIARSFLNTFGRCTVIICCWLSRQRNFSILDSESWVIACKCWGGELHTLPESLEESMRPTSVLLAVTGAFIS